MFNTEFEKANKIVFEKLMSIPSDIFRKSLEEYKDHYICRIIDDIRLIESRFEESTSWEDFSEIEIIELPRRTMVKLVLDDVFSFHRTIEDFKSSNNELILKTELNRTSIITTNAEMYSLGYIMDSELAEAA
jgi:hypothetical protein